MYACIIFGLCDYLSYLIIYSGVILACTIVCYVLLERIITLGQGCYDCYRGYSSPRNNVIKDISMTHAFNIHYYYKSRECDLEHKRGNVHNQYFLNIYFSIAGK